MIKISSRFLKSLKENRNKKGLIKALKVKIGDFDKYFSLSHQKMIDSDRWIVKKIDATSGFGAYRIIMARDLQSNRVVYDFYFKNDRSDMTHDEIQSLKSFLSECENSGYFDTLEDIENLDK